MPVKRAGELPLSADQVTGGKFQKRVMQELNAGILDVETDLHAYLAEEGTHQQVSCRHKGTTYDRGPMEYERSTDGQIQTAFAYRAGQLLLQYEQFSPGLATEERFEATLAVALLQALLTSCQELVRSQGSKAGKGSRQSALPSLASRLLLDEPTLLGMDADCIVTCWPSERGLTYREVIDCLRNALSHPGAQGSSAYPRTGFTTEQSDSPSVEAYLLTQSSWVNNKGSGLLPRFAPERRDEQARSALERLVHEWSRNHRVEGLEVALNADGKWRVLLAGQLFVPVLQLRLGVRQLRTLTLALCDYLSEPARQRDGVAA